MHFGKMRFVNYGSFHGDHEFDFTDRGVVALLGRNLDDPRSKSNGSGKSTLLDALDWCLFGEVPRGDSVDSIRNEEAVVAGQGTRVEVEVHADDGAMYLVSRVRGMKSRKDGPALDRRVDATAHPMVGDLTALDAAETQKRIEAVLGLDRGVFRAAVLFAQGDEWTFADATDTERKAMLLKVLDLTELDAWAARVKAMTEGETTILSQVQMMLASATGTLDQLLREDPTHAAAAWEADNAARVDRLAALAQAAGTDVASAQAALSYAQHQHHVVSANSVPPPPAAPPDMTAEDRALVNVGATALNSAREALSTSTARVRLAEGALNRITQTKTGLCSTCGQPVTGEHLQQERSRLTADLENLHHEALAAHEALRLAEANAALAQQRAQAVNAAQSAWQQHVAAYRAEEARVASSATQAASHMAALGEAVQRAHRAWAQRTEEHAAALHAVNPWAAKLTRYATDVAAAASHRDGLAQRVAGQEAVLTHLAFWREAFGAHGLRSFVLDARIDEMSNEANRWVSLLTGGTTWVRFETTKMVGKGKNARASDSLTLRVFRHNPDGSITDRPFRSWSGGEKHRIALGVDFGLARLVSNRAKCRYDLIILDEAFASSLDSSGKEAVADMLRELAKEKSTVLVVDHDVMFQGLFEEVVVVEKHNRRSRVVESGK